MGPDIPDIAWQCVVDLCCHVAPPEWVQMYQDQCQDPPVDFHMPEFSGKVLWARQLLHHIEQPMDLVKVRRDLLHSCHGKAIVKKYNKMALVLTEYELVHYRSWTSIIEATSNNLQVRGPHVLCLY